MNKNVQQKKCAEMHSITKGCEQFGVTFLFLCWNLFNKAPLIPSYSLLPLTNRFLMQSQRLLTFGCNIKLYLKTRTSLQVLNIVKIYVYQDLLTFENIFLFYLPMMMVISLHCIESTFFFLFTFLIINCQSMFLQHNTKIYNINYGTQMAGKNFGNKRTKNGTNKH